MTQGMLLNEKAVLNLWAPCEVANPGTMPPGPSSLGKRAPTSATSKARSASKKLNPNA